MISPRGPGSVRSPGDSLGDRRHLASLRAPRAYDELRRRTGARHAGAPLRVGGLRRAGDHRPLGADGRALDEEAARHPVDRAERVVRAARERRSRARARRAGRPGDPRQRVRAAAGGRRLDRRERRRPVSSRTPTGAACAPTSGRAARGCSGSRSGTPAASSRSGEATRRCTGTRRSSAGGAGTRSRPTTRIIPATTAALRGPGCARAEKSQEAVLDALRTGAFYGSTGPAIHGVDVTDGDVVVRCSPARASRSTPAVRAARAPMRAGSAIRTAHRCSSATTTA